MTKLLMGTHGSTPTQHRACDSSKYVLCQRRKEMMSQQLVHSDDIPRARIVDTSYRDCSMS